MKKKTYYDYVPACALATLLLSTTLCLADSARSQASDGDNQSARRAATETAPDASNQNLLEQLRKAKPMPPRPMPSGDASTLSKAAPRLVPEGLGTVTKRIGGNVSATPPNKPVERSLKKQSGLTPPIPTCSRRPTGEH